MKEGVLRLVNTCYYQGEQKVTEGTRDWVVSHIIILA